MKIVFMGTPDFAVPCLQKLIDSDHSVVGVFTQPDKPKGRHGVLTAPPVKELAVRNNIPVFQPVKMRDGTALDMLKSVNPDLVIVVAYGKILPPDILDYPKFGCINIHASLLPKLRGSAPIQWSILNGMKETGVTAMQMDAGLDTGDMLLFEKIEITENMNAEQLHDSLSVLGSEVLTRVLEKVEADELHPVKQNEEEATYVPMLSKELSPIDWDKTAQDVHNHIRGLYGWPCSTARYDGKTIKIHKSIITDIKGNYPGEIVEKQDRIIVCCGDLKCIEILELQAENKKSMSTGDFLRGNRIESDRFE